MASTVCFLKSFSAICSAAASFFENVKHVIVEKKHCSHTLLANY